MSGNSIGQQFQVTTFGESHGLALGAIVDGCPPGLALTEQDLQPVSTMFFLYQLGQEERQNRNQDP